MTTKLDVGAKLGLIIGEEMKQSPAHKSEWREVTERFGVFYEGDGLRFICILLGHDWGELKPRHVTCLRCGRVLMAVRWNW